MNEAIGGYKLSTQNESGAPQNWQPKENLFFNNFIPIMRKCELLTGKEKRDRNNMVLTY